MLRWYSENGDGPQWDKWRWLLVVRPTECSFFSQGKGGDAGIKAFQKLKKKRGEHQIDNKLHMFPHSSGAIEFSARGAAAVLAWFPF